MLLCDKDVRDLCHRPDPMISPYCGGHQGGNIISYGATHAGYDIRLGHKYKVFKNPHNTPVDPKKMKEDPDYQKMFLEDCVVAKDGDIIVVPAHSYILGYSIEHFIIPRNISGTCVGKSTYARCGIVVNTTPLEPDWRGHLTLEIANVSPCPVHLFAGEGIAQVRFDILSGTPETSYADKGGKYQDQGPEPIPARVLA